MIASTLVQAIAQIWACINDRFDGTPLTAIMFVTDIMFIADIAFKYDIVKLVIFKRN